jgi:hypothetical protein
MAWLVLLVACGGSNDDKPITDADCEAWVAKIRECPLPGMRSDAAEREDNLKWRLGKCKEAVVEKPTPADALGNGLQRAEARCGRAASSCAVFHACTDKAHDDAVHRATDHVMSGT